MNFPRHSTNAEGFLFCQKLLKVGVKIAQTEVLTPKNYNLVIQNYKFVTFNQQTVFIDIETSVSKTPNRLF